MVSAHVDADRPVPDRLGGRALACPAIQRVLDVAGWAPYQCNDPEQRGVLMVMSSGPSRRTALQALGLLGLALTTGSGLSACGSPPNSDEARVDLERAAMETDRAVAGPMLTAQAGGLLREVMAREDGNVVFSPWSIAVVMGMNRAGAAGTTAEQIDRALHFPAGAGNARDAALNTASLVLDSHNRTYEEGKRKGDVILRSANSTWARSDIAWLRTYLDTLARYYGAGVRLTDFSADPAGARRQINAWVSDHTEHHITDLVPDGAITPLTALALVNAVYLEAPWAQDFKPEQTRPGAFTRADGSSKQVPMMHGSVSAATGLVDARHQQVTLPYLGGTLAMTAVLPHEGRERDVAVWLTNGGITEVITRRGEPDVDVTMPKLAFRSTIDLSAVLKSLGITDAFDLHRADYSGMTKSERLYISAALHQATIEVDEQGTVATAASAVVMSTLSAPSHPQTIVLDRPFFFVIHDLEAKVPIFVGRVADPSQTS